MNKKDTILLELQEISPAVANLNKGDVYTVPFGYFERLPTEILAITKAENLFEGAKERLFTTPNGYFNDLADNILLKVKQSNNSSSDIFDELESVAPLLNSIDKKNYYAIPAGYFQNLAIQFPEKQAAKVIAFNKWKKWTNYVAAAVFAGVLAMGAIKFIDSNSSKSSFEIELSKSSDEEIKQILDNQSSTNYTFVGTVSDEQDGLSIFEGTSEEELQQFLKEQPEMAEKTNKDI